MLRFDPIPYPLWRYRTPALLEPFLRMGLAPFTAADADFDANPPVSPTALAHYLARGRVLPPGMDAADAKAAFIADTRPVERAVDDLTPQPPLHYVAEGERYAPMILPAQWANMESVIVTFPVFYPALWEAHLQMIEAISAVAIAEILIPAAFWAKPIRLHLEQRGRANLDNVHLLLLPTDDIWVRDYGPFVGYTPSGERIALDAHFDTLPNYPQTRDNAMAARWAATRGLPVRRIDLHTEGGNVWSDGAGTLLMSEDIYERNPGLSRAEVSIRLHEAFAFERLILTPYILREETGHIDLMVKLIDAETVMVGSPPLTWNSARLAHTRAIFQGETNARGARYRVIDVPMPPLYLNWGVFPVFRSYTNALTINGRVLVPTFGCATDDAALRLYAEAMPAHEIIPIDCRYTSNGGGAVHCLTHEIPAALPKEEVTNDG